MLRIPLSMAVIAILGLSVSACNDKTNTATSSAPQPESEFTAIIADMTLDEKLAQITCVWRDKSKFLDQAGNFSAQKMKANFPHGAGCIARPQDTMGMETQQAPTDVNDATVVRRMSARTPSETVALTNAIQKWMIEETRLGIPTLFHEEGLHGFQGRYATSFPQSIALASTFDEALVERIFSITAQEIRARGAHHVLSPVVDVALDPRWGRIEETYGEDPFLVSRMGVAAVKGFQGKDINGVIAPDKVLTTLKHMTGHGQPESGTNVGPAQLPERVLREVFFPPFEAAITEAGAATVMASYNEIDGVPSHANAWLLNTVLRDEWGFDGAVVADYFAINELNVRHSIVDSLGKAGALSIASGVDIELPDGAAFYAMKSLIESGDLDIAIVDQAVERMLRIKKRAGLFDEDKIFADAAEAETITGNEAARKVALEAAHKAPILLKNENNILPLKTATLKKVALIGPNSDITVLGGYSDEPRQTVSILSGLQSEFGENIDLVHAKGVKLTNNRSWWDDDVDLISPDENFTLIKQAVDVAKGADIIVVAIGGDESTSREAWSETHMGDRDDITLIGQQKELIEALADTGIPIVAVVISGRPLSLLNVEEHFSAVLYGWLLGQETGTAIANILVGKVSPSGKMPVTVPRNVGQIPAFYNHKPTARRGYAFTEDNFLYTFGSGLSYTTFDISEPTLEKASIGKQDSTSVSVSVTNTGTMQADEVIQLYIRDKVSSVTRPVKELKGFARVSLAPGETKQVSLPITPSSLRFYDINMQRVVEAGEFDIMVGNSSTNTQSVILTVE